MTEAIIVIPCYNEAQRLDADAFKNFVARQDQQQLLFVNDGSTDATRDLLTQLCDTAPDRMMFCDLPQNQGKAEAVRHGILQAIEKKPAFVGFWDADLATPLQTIPDFCRLLQTRPELQMAIGSRVRLLGRSVDRRPLRHYLGRAFATVASLGLALPVYDTQCGAKLFRNSPEMRALFAEPFRANWIFDVELLARFIRNNNANRKHDVRTAVCEVPLQEWRDVAGSKVKARDFLKAMLELVTIYWTYLRPGASAKQPQQQTDFGPRALLTPANSTVDALHED